MPEETRFHPADMLVIGVSVLIIIVILFVVGADFTAVPGVLRLIADPNYLMGFGVMWLQIILVSIVGGGIGVVIGALISRSKSFDQAVIRFLRYVQWLPFFVYWPSLSVQSLVQLGKGLPRWVLVVLWGVQATFPHVMLAASYHYLSFRSAESKSVSVHFEVMRTIVLRAFLVCLWWQLFFQPLGWNWFSLLRLHENTNAALALIALVALSVLAINLFSRSSFASSAEGRATLIMTELQKNNLASLFGALLIAVGSLLLWQLFAATISKLFLIPSPSDVFKTVYRLIWSGGTIWANIGISLFEICGGLTGAAVLAFLISQQLALQTSFKRPTLFFLSLTELTPIGLWLLLFPSVGPHGPWHKMILVAALTFFPLIQALWALRDRGILCRLILSLEDALPFAFVAIFLGELFAATEGLGFSAVVAAATHSFAEATAICLIILVLLVGISATLRWVAGTFLLPGIRIEDRKRG